MEPSVAQLLARETAQTKFEDLPPEVVHEAKRRIIDTVGCVIGGADSAPSRVMERVCRDMGGPPKATVFGKGFRTSALQATLANGVMLRFTEAMDRAFDGPDGLVAHGHPSEVIPSLIAIGEQEDSTGRELLTAVVLGYEFLNRLSYAAGGAIEIERRGFKNEIRAAVAVPLGVGKLLRLREQELVNAVGISGCFAGGLGITQHESEQTTMVRNLRFPFLAHNGVLAAEMAKRGFEGPTRVFEGSDGLASVMFPPHFDLERVTRRGSEFSILYTWTKAYPVFGAMQGLAEAAEEVAKASNVEPEQIERVTVRTTPLVARLGGDPETRRYPETKETADHSVYFVTALAIVDKAIHANLDQFTQERFKDPRIRRVASKIDIVPDPNRAFTIGPNEVQIRTHDGQLYEYRVDYPKGHMRKPLSDAELERKFRDLAGRLMTEAQMVDMIDAVWHLENGAARDLTRLLVL